MTIKKPVPPIEDLLDCVHRNIAKIRPDILLIIHEEMKSVVEEILRELRKPKPLSEVIGHNRSNC